MLFYVLLFCPSKVNKKTNPHVVLGLEAFWSWLHWPKFTHYKIHAVPLWSVFSSDMSIPSNKLIPMLSWVYRPLVLGAMTEAKGVTEPSLLHAWWVQTVVMLCCFMFCYFVHPKSTKRQIPMLSWVWKPSGPGCTDPSSPITKSMLCPCEAFFRLICQPLQTS